MKKGKNFLIPIISIVATVTLIVAQGSGYLSQKLMVENNIRDRIKDALSKLIESHKYVVNVDVELEVLDEINAPKYIDYMSLDTEGSELHVLMGLDFNKYTIGYMNVEHNYNSQLRGLIHQFLQKKGYIYSRWNKFDDEFIHDSLAKVYSWSNNKTDMTPKFN